MAPQLAALAGRQGDKVVVLKVDVDRNRELAMKAGVRSIPDMRLLHGGRQLEKMVGSRSVEQLEQVVAKHAGRLPDRQVSAPARIITPEVQAPGEASIRKMEKDWLPPGVTPVR